MTPWNPETWLKASRFAAEAHIRQQVPGTELPYLLHLTSVAMEVVGALVYEEDLDGDLAVACALLHDTVEDTAITVAQVTAIFGPAVAAGVAALSKDASLPKSERMADSLQRLGAQPPSVQLVKLADRITNLQPPPSHWSTDKTRRYVDEAEDILAALGASSPYLAARIRSKIDAYRMALPG